MVEHYELTWAGKTLAQNIANKPSTSVLVPCPDESVDWDSTRNLLIEGDNIDALKILQESYRGRVDMVYIDPPYNIGKKTVYKNDYSSHDSALNTGDKIHAGWLSMMYPRLQLARSLLSSTGSLVCAIDDREVLDLGILLDEIFDPSQYTRKIVSIVNNPRGIEGCVFSRTNEYAFFVYPTSGNTIGRRHIPKDEVKYRSFRRHGAQSERSHAKNCFYPVIVEGGKVVGFGDVCAEDIHPQRTEQDWMTTYVYPIDESGVERRWGYARRSVDAVQHLLRVRNGKIEIGKDSCAYRTVWDDSRYDSNAYGSQIVKSLVPDSPFMFPKSLWAVHDCIQACVGENPNAIVLDFFAGSGTTGHAVMELNKGDGGKRLYILVQLPETLPNHPRFNTIADITKERLRRAGSELKSDGYNGDVGFRVMKIESRRLRL